MKPTDFSESLKRSFNEFIAVAKMMSKEHKFAAHERLFKLILNLSTLALTGWIVIVAWRFETFPTMKHAVYSSCVYFIGSLLLISLSDLFGILHASTNEYLNSKLQDLWIKKSIRLDFLPVEYGDGKIDGESYLDLVQKTFKEEPFEPTHHVPKAWKIEKIFLKLIWITGISGYILFFYAVYFGVNAMTNYVASVQGTK